MVEYNPQPATNPMYSPEASGPAVQYDAGDPMGPGYNPSIDSIENNSFDMGQGYGDQGNQPTFQGSTSANYGMPSQTNNQPDFSGPISVFDSQCPTGGNCVKCTYRCRMKKVA